MNQKRYWIQLGIVGVTIASFAVAPAYTYACSPPSVPISTTTPQQFFNAATHVFSGKVLSVQKKMTPDQHDYTVATSTLEVSSYWKGDVKKTTQVVTINNGAGCKYPYVFEVGQEYLVYATYNADQNALVTQASYWGGPGTQPLKEAGWHLAFLGAGKTPLGASVPPIPPNPPTAASFGRNLSVGMVGEDVRNLQKYLNQNGFAVSVSGAGSAGNETTYFGFATKAALIKFQTAHAVELGISQGTGYFGPLTRALIAG